MAAILIWPAIASDTGAQDAVHSLFLVDLNRESSLGGTACGTSARQPNRSGTAAMKACIGSRASAGPGYGLPKKDADHMYLFYNRARRQTYQRSALQGAESYAEVAVNLVRSD